MFELSRVVDPEAKGKAPLMNKDDYVVMFRKDVRMRGLIIFRLLIYKRTISWVSLIAR